MNHTKLAVRLENTGLNTHTIHMRDIDIYFSYDTPVAFWVSGNSEPTVSENVWSRTTGKHINLIDGGNTNHRIDNDLFVSELDEILNGELK